MRENNLTENPDKCLFNQPSIDFFGHHFFAEGISADDKNIHPSSMPVLQRMHLRHIVFLVWPSILRISSRMLCLFLLQSVN